MIDGEKLRDILKSKGISAMELARRLGWTGAPTYLYNLMNGKHEATQEFLERVSEAVEIPPILIMKDDLLKLFRPNGGRSVNEERERYIANQCRFPIVGYVSAGEASVPEYLDGDMPAGQGVLGNIHLGATAGADAYAVRVKGDSMRPRFRAGNVLVISPTAEWGHGDICLVRHADGRVWIKRITDRAGVLSLEPDNPNYESIPLRRDEINYIHKVIVAVLR